MPQRSCWECSVVVVCQNVLSSSRYGRVVVVLVVCRHIARPFAFSYNCVRDSCNTARSLDCEAMRRFASRRIKVFGVATPLQPHQSQTLRPTLGAELTSDGDTIIHLPGPGRCRCSRRRGLIGGGSRAVPVATAVPRHGTRAVPSLNGAASSVARPPARSAKLWS